MFFQALQQKIQIVDALAAADNFAIPFRGDEIDAQSDLRAVLRRREVEGFDASRKPVHNHGPVETLGQQRLVGVGGQTRTAAELRRQRTDFARGLGVQVGGVDRRSPGGLDRPALLAHHHVAGLALDHDLDLARLEVDGGQAVLGGDEQLVACRGVGVLVEVEAGTARLFREPDDAVASVGIDPTERDSVGGGGIGFYLWDTIRAFNDREAATVILLIVAMVMGIDVLSARIRRAVI